MLKGFRAVRPDERRDTWTAFAMLFLFIGSHAVLETARDALFLSKVPATQLPWMYLAIAAVSLGTAQLQSHLSRRMRARMALSLWTFVAAVVTGGFWLGFSFLGSGGLYGLYVWSGVLTTLVLVHFWSLLGDIFSVTQAKRLFGVVGAGSVFGAIVGSGLAGTLARVTDPRHLLLVSATGFAMAALIARVFRDGGSAETPELEEEAPMAASEGLLGGARFVFSNAYARRIVQILLIAAAALTLTDFLFKSVIVEAVPPDALGATLGTIYFGLNLASLVVQLVVVNYVLRRFDLVTALAILPFLLLVGAIGVAAIPIVSALVAALLLKAPDGAFRYSLHRTSTELLFVPLSDAARRKVKAFIDVVGQRGGQAIASIAILTVTALSLPLWASAALLVVLLGGWLVSAFGMRKHYLELFRGRLRHSQLEYLAEFPELDVASLETLVAALDSDNVPEVIAALDVLEREKKSHLIPALILYHPDEDVLIRTMAIFAKAKRMNVLKAIDRLFEHPSPRVRSAAVTTRVIIAPDPKKLSLQLSLEDSAEVRATIVVNLIAMGEIVGVEADDRIEEFASRGSVETRIALAEAITRQSSTRYHSVLVKLSEAPEPEVRMAALRAMADANAEELLPTIVRFIGREKTRPVATKALLSFGDKGFEVVLRALDDVSLRFDLRWQMPGIVAQFEPDKAAEALLRRLGGESDGMVRYRIIRALETLRDQSPDIQLDIEALNEVVDDTIGRAYRYLDRRVILDRGAKERASRATRGHQLLSQLLRDKYTHALERLFRLLGLVHPSEDFRRIARGLSSERRELQASSIELLENVLTGNRRRAVVGLVDDAPDEEKLSSCEPYHHRLKRTYEELLEDLLDSSSGAVTDITAFHVGELGLTELQERLSGLPQTPDIQLAIERMSMIEATSGEEMEASVAH